MKRIPRNLLVTVKKALYPRSSPKKKPIARRKKNRRNLKRVNRSQSVLLRNHYRGAAKKIFHTNILRFRMRSGKTQRVYCYNEEDLGWPAQFTTKINTQVADNDRDSDDETIQEDIKRGCNALFKAIRQRSRH